eukprot:gene1705-1999_t
MEKPLGQELGNAVYSNEYGFSPVPLDGMSNGSSGRAARVALLLANSVHTYRAAVGALEDERLPYRRRRRRESRRSGSGREEEGEGEEEQASYESGAAPYSWSQSDRRGRAVSEKGVGRGGIARGYRCAGHTEGEDWDGEGMGESGHSVASVPSTAHHPEKAYSGYGGGGAGEGAGTGAWSPSASVSVSSEDRAGALRLGRSQTVVAGMAPVRHLPGQLLGIQSSRRFQLSSLLGDSRGTMVSLQRENGYGVSTTYATASIPRRSEQKKKRVEYLRVGTE